MKKLTSYWRELIIASLLIWAIVRGNYNDCDNCYNKVQEIDLTINEERIWEGFDTLSFNEAFNQMYIEYGQGHAFDWRGKVYLTNLKEGE